MIIKAVGFDFFGTLVHAKVDKNLCTRNMFDTLHEHEVDMPLEDFLQMYKTVTSSYSKSDMHATEKSTIASGWLKLLRNSDIVSLLIIH